MPAAISDRYIAVNCISFEEALKQAKAESAQDLPTLLLGNGFGIAYDADIFSYKAIFNSVDWANARRVQRVFEELKTWDFEVAIRNLDIAANIADIYGWAIRQVAYYETTLIFERRVDSSDSRDSSSPHLCGRFGPNKKNG